MQLIDTHVHINFDAFEPDLDAVARHWREAGVVRLVHSCVDPSEFAKTQALADRFPELSFSVGLHPLDMDKWTDTLAQEILALAQSDRRVVAIGETGLDFFKADNQAAQLTALTAQLRIAQQLNLPVILHCREAAAAMREALVAFQAAGPATGPATGPVPGPVTGVMHCWGGSPAETQWFLDLGFYISFSGIVTFKKATQIHDSARMVPADRLLIETDCPFLSPVPKRGEKRNEPANVQYVAQALADLRGVSVADIAAQTTRNACELFRLAPV
jgi:TatD DNase family protein